MKNDQQSTREINYWRDDTNRDSAVARRRAVWALAGNCLCCVLFTLVWGFYHLVLRWDIGWLWIGFQCLGAVIMPPVMLMVLLLFRCITVSYDYWSPGPEFHRNVYKIQGYIFIQYVSTKIFSMYAVRMWWGIELLTEPMVWVGAIGYLASFCLMARRVIHDDIVSSIERARRRMLPLWPLRLLLLAMVYYLYIHLQYVLEYLRACAGC